VSWWCCKRHFRRLAVDFLILEILKVSVEDALFLSSVRADVSALHNQLKAVFAVPAGGHLGRRAKLEVGAGIKGELEAASRLPIFADVSDALAVL